MSRSPSPPVLRVPLVLACAVAVAAPGPAAARSTPQWTEVEPPHVAPVVALAAPPVGGRGGTVVASLRSPQLALPLAFSGAGTARTVDGSAGWRHAHGPHTPPFYDLERHPTDSDVLFGADTYVWRSGDGGVTWSAIYLPGANAVTALAVDPLEPERLYGVGYVWTFGSTFHRSVDGGATWTATHPVFFQDHEDVAVAAGPHPGTSAVLLAGPAGIHRSLAGGESFANVFDQQAARRFAVVAEARHLVWCLTETSNGQTRLWRSRDGGAHWSPAASPADDLADVAAHPSDPDRAWTVGPSGAFATADGGQTWSAGTGLAAAAGLTSLTVVGAEAGTLIAGGKGGYGGAWRSVDGGASWSHASAGLRAAAPHLRFGPDGTAWAVGLGVPVRSAGGVGPWEVLDYADGTETRAVGLDVHPTDPTAIAWVRQAAEWWESNRLLVSLDDGASWTDASPPGANGSTYEIHQVAFGAPEPDGSAALYASSFGDFNVSHDLGATWITHVSPWTSLRQLVADPHDPGRLHALDAASYHTSADGGATWNSHPVVPGVSSFPADLQFGSAGSLLVLTTHPEWALLRSIDGGATWSATGAGLPILPLARLAADPHDPTRVLVGTVGDGVHLSLDGGLSFQPWGDGLGAGVAVASLAFGGTADPGGPGHALLSAVSGRLYVRDVP